MNSSPIDKTSVPAPANYRDMVELNPDAVIIIDDALIIRYANRKAEILFGRDRGELLGQAFGYPITKESPVEVNLVDRSGAVLWGEMRVAMTLWDNAPATLVVIRDITERKHAQERHRSSQEKLQNIFDNINTGIALINRDLQILELNHRMKEWFPRAENTEHSFCYNILNDPICETPCEDCPVIRAFSSGSPAQGIKSSLRNGRATTYRIMASPVKGEDGSIQSAIVLLEDITERMALEEELRHSQKMEALGHLAGGVAHDFNNMLQVILGAVEFAQDDFRSGQNIQEHLEQIRSTTEKSAHLVSKLLTFARRQILNPVRLDLNRKVEDSLKLLRRVIPENIHLKFLPGDQLHAIVVDTIQVDQVIFNLCINARDAMPAGGDLIIETRNTHFDTAFCTTNAWARPGSYVRLRTSDTGCGIPEEHLEQIFDPFFTTKGFGQGTGLGLAMIYGIVEQHKGFIHVSSRINEGSIFEIYFPACPAEDTPPEPVRTRTSRGGHETILVVEDNAHVLSIVKKMLESAGYQVITAYDGMDAIRVLRQESDRIELALLDIVMPRLGGKDLYLFMRQQFPRIKAVFATGYAAETFYSGLTGDRKIRLIQKPYSKSLLLETVRDVLDETDPG